MEPVARIRLPENPPAPSSGPPRLKHWTFAGLLLTYWCNARCAFCYVYSGPNKKGPRLTAAQAVTFWQGLNRLLERSGLKGSDGRPLPCKVHLAGGEPFGDFAHLLEVARAAQAAGLSIFEKVETNAFWATSDEETRRKITLLRDAGMQMLMISSDVYHQEFVPVERCLRAARLAREILGEKGVRVRWWDFIDQPVDVMKMPPEERRRALADALLRHRERLLGRAADALADYYECHPPEHFAAQNCRAPTLESKHVHIDGYGNVFPGVCSGIVWGRVESPGAASDSPAAPSADGSPPAPQPGVWPQRFASIEQLWHHASEHWPEHPVIGPVVENGPYRLYTYARDRGFEPRPGGYANKCHLCHDVRRWLWQRGEFGAALGPAEVYSETPKPHVDGRSVSLPVLDAPPP